MALVTGAARGLGRAISLALAPAGADVALGRRDEVYDGDLPEEIERLGRWALPLQMDVMRVGQIFAAVDDAPRTSAASSVPMSWSALRRYTASASRWTSPEPWFSWHRPRLR